MTRRGWIASLAAGMAPLGAADFRDFTQRILDQINALRISREAAALIWSESVAACAVEQSERKALLKFPGHNDPERGDVGMRLNAAGIDWNFCGENLFMERGYDDPVNLAVVSWWYSPGHRENLLNPIYSHTGLGITRNADGAFYTAQIFVTPRLKLKMGSRGAIQGNASPGGAFRTS